MSLVNVFQRSLCCVCRLLSTANVNLSFLYHNCNRLLFPVDPLVKKLEVALTDYKEL